MCIFYGSIHVIIVGNFLIFKLFNIFAVPNEPVKGPCFKKFPESQTVHENQPVTFTAEIEKDADKGITVILNYNFIL